jgi:hypothetical protein
MSNQRSKWNKRNIAIKDLSLWDGNARFPEEYFSKKESELIEYFLKRKDLKVVNLAKEIASEFDLPQLEKVVVLELDGKNIVIEGNRRLTAYKILIRPSIIKNNEIRKSLEELKRKIFINEDFVLEAITTTDKEEGLRFVDRKHNKGNNEVGWGEPERRNFAIRRSNGKVRDVVRVELANAVKKINLPDSIKEAVLGKGYVTTFYRITDSLPAREKMGYSIMEDGRISVKNQENFNDFLKIIIFNIWNKIDFSGKNIDSRSLNKASDIKDYFDRIKKKDVDSVDKDINKQTKNDLFGEKTITPATSNRDKQLSVMRKYLISSSIYISDKRINDIYNELRKKVEVDVAPNAVAVLFRVFLECSVDCYIEKNKISIKSDIELAGKVLKVVDHLEDVIIQEYFFKNEIKNPSEKDIKEAKQKFKFKEIRKVATKDNNSVLSITTFHDFVHDYKISPIPSELKKYWDNLDDFFSALWKSLKDKKK